MLHGTAVHDRRGRGRGRGRGWASRALLGLLLSLGMLATAAGPAAAQPGIPLTKVIVRLKPNTSLEAAISQAQGQGAKVSYRYRTALVGFALEIPQQAVAALRANPQIAAVDPDTPVTASATQSSAPWGLDRVDQRALPLSGSYTYPADGAGVTAYVVDTGILAGHTDFGGRVRSGYTAITDGRGTTDCNGHGTHVAGTLAGSTYGVAKAATPVAVRVLDCTGSGSMSGVIAGLDWAAADHAAGTPAVANLSLGGPTNSSLDAAVTALVNDGVSVSVAAGNDGVNACTQSPARAAAALTVASSDRTDTRSSFSNFGTCVDVIAPGSSIVSDWYTGPTATTTLSGTSMATPHVAGAAAVLLSQQRTLTPAQVASRLVGSATTGVVKNAGTGTPNKLLFVDTPVVTPLSVTNPGNQTTTAGTAVSLTMKATDGAPPYTWSATGLPAGLTINPSSGVISGNPAAAAVAAAATSAVTVTVTDSGGATATTSFTWTVNAAPTCTGGGQKLANPGFESGTTGWTASYGVISKPGSAKPPHTGSWNATLGDSAFLSTTTLSQSVAIPAGCSTVTLSFWLRVTTKETTTSAQNDKLTVTLGDSPLATYSNLDASTDYVQRTLTVAGQAGKTVQLRFSTTQNRTSPTTFAVDDTALTAG
jgi:subtilisin family serine protease